MRKASLLLLMVFAFTLSNAQVFKHEQLVSATKKPKAKFLIYESENGDVFRVGNFITIANPSNENNYFQHILETDGFSITEKASISSKGWEAEIIKFKVTGTKRMGYSVIAVCKTEVGNLRYWIYVEKATRDGEIQTSILTREQAIAKLKEAKDLLDLEMMTQEEYDKLKKELAPIIRQ